MERLTIRDKDGLIAHSRFKGDWASQNILQSLADYEDAEEQGLLLRLPCAIGTTVYQITKTLSYGEIGDTAEVNYRISEVEFNLCMIDFIDKIVFLTKEEAEQALKQMGE